MNSRILDGVVGIIFIFLAFASAIFPLSGLTKGENIILYVLEGSVGMPFLAISNYGNREK
jgi:hypothetical protein